MSENIFPSNAAAIGFGIVILLWLLSELIGGKIIPRMRRGGRTVQKRNIGSNTIVYIAWIAVLAVSIDLAGSNIALLPSYVYYVGITVMLAGIVVRQWAIAVLGRYFSGVIGIQKGQKVVQTGPYLLVRHPSYTGIFMIQLGVALAVHSWGSVVAVVVIFGLAFGHRILVEEKVLINELGDSYIEYMKRTKRLIPFIL